MMFLLAVEGKESEGAYAPLINNKNILYMFEEQDDAERYSMQLEADDYPRMSVVEVPDEVAFRLCEDNEYSYCVITPNDIVVPPN
jgi:hypothetical protein